MIRAKRPVAMVGNPTRRGGEASRSDGRPAPRKPPRAVRPSRPRPAYIPSGSGEPGPGPGLALPPRRRQLPPEKADQSRPAFLLSLVGRRIRVLDRDGGGEGAAGLVVVDGARPGEGRGGGRPAASGLRPGKARRTTGWVAASVKRGGAMEAWNTGGGG